MTISDILSSVAIVLSFVSLLHIVVIQYGRHIHYYRYSVLTGGGRLNNKLMHCLLLYNSSLNRSIIIDKVEFKFENNYGGEVFGCTNLVLQPNTQYSIKLPDHVLDVVVTFKGRVFESGSPFRKRKIVSSGYHEALFLPLKLHNSFILLNNI